MVKFRDIVELAAAPTADLQAATKRYVDLVPRVVEIAVTDPAGSALTTGDGKAYFVVPVLLNNWKLTAVLMGVTTVSSSGIPTFQIANVTDSIDMLSTKLTVDASEFNSTTAATAAVIDTASSHDVVTSGDLLRMDCDVAGTGVKGVMIAMTFTAP